MAKRRSSNHPNTAKTGKAVKQAVREVEHAVRPDTRSPVKALEWFIAIAAGGVAAVRSFRAAKAETSHSSGDPKLPSDLRAGDGQPLATSAAAAVRDVSIAAAGARTQGPELPKVGETEEHSSRGAGPPSPSAENGVGRQAQAGAEHHGRSGPAEKHTARDGEAAVVGGDALSLGKELFNRFNQDEGMTRASALAFVAVLSIIPVLLFALAALGFFIKDPAQVVKYVHSAMAQVLPGSRGSAAVNDLITATGVAKSAQGLMRGKWLATLFGFVSLLFSAVGFVAAAAGPMNAAWNVKETRNFVQLRLISLGVFLAAAVLFGLSVISSSGPDFLQHLHIPWLGLPKHPPFLLAAALQVLLVLIALAFDVALFTLLYWFLPNTQVSWKAALAGGVVTGVLFEIFKKCFAVYLAHFGNFNKLYGALGGLFLLVTWIYYSCAVLILGAIVCKLYHEHVEEGGVKHRAEPAKTFRKGSDPAP